MVLSMPLQKQTYSQKGNEMRTPAQPATKGHKRVSIKFKPLSKVKSLNPKGKDVPLN